LQILDVIDANDHERCVVYITATTCRLGGITTKVKTVLAPAIPTPSGLTPEKRAKPHNNVQIVSRRQSIIRASFANNDAQLQNCSIDSRGTKDSSGLEWLATSLLRSFSFQREKCCLKIATQGDLYSLMHPIVSTGSLYSSAIG
jgi:hypothetical protein